MAHNDEMNLAWRFIEGTQVSVFLTGKAGTGKTTFLKKIREILPKRMVVLAPTGIAAINANGQTIHSFFQLPLTPFLPGTQMAQKEGKYYRMSKEKKNLLRTMDLLVIDEISMVRADLLDAVDDVMRRYRNPAAPFGGVQLLLIGDLQQLAPVVKDEEWDILSKYYSSPFFFCSRALQEMRYVTIELKKIYRQQDKTFIDILAAIRENKITEEVLALLNSRYIPNFSPENEQIGKQDPWIRLTTHNFQANNLNQRQIEKIPAHAYTFEAEIKGTFPEQSFPAEHHLTLKIGAQVMFIKNDTQQPRRYYNGRIGIVTAMTGDGIVVRCINEETGKEEDILVEPVVWENMRYTIDETTKEIKEEIEGTFTQYPLRLAWAITVHKSQGLTFKRAILDINNSFAHGQVYVALSRCRTLDGLVLTAPLNRNSIISDNEIDNYIASSIESSKKSEGELPRFRYEYYYSILNELFSFGKLSYDFEHLLRVAGNNFTNSQQTFIELLRTLFPRINTELIQVADKFRLQYDRIILEAGSNYQNDPKLQERILSASHYFLEKTEDICEGIITDANIVCKALKNKTVQKQLQIAIDALELSYTIKKKTLQAIQYEGFSPNAYLSNKAKASIVEEKKKKKSSKQKPFFKNKGLVILFMLVSTLSLFAQKKLGNPIINHMYSADPSARVFGDTLWIYPSHDKDNADSFSMEDYHAYSTTDLKTWKDHGVIFNPISQTVWAKKEAWAPDCIFRNGKYYLYYPTDKKHIGVAVSENPQGPFSDPIGKPLLSIDSPGVICNRDFIDPCVFIDDDGQAYLFAGQNTVCCIKLNEDMISYDGEVHIIQGAKDFFEAVWVHKRNGKYYMSYSDGPFRGHEPRIVYATSDSPLGPYTYQGVILDPVNSGTNHASIVNYKGQDLLFYHTADLSKHLHDGFHCGVRRSVCCDTLRYDNNGMIQKVMPTTDSSRLLQSDVSIERREAMLAASVSAPKIPQKEFKLPKKVTREVLQKAIDNCSDNGGGKVLVHAGEHKIDGPILLKNNVCLHLKDGAKLLFSENPDCYLPAVFSRWEGTELYNRSSMIRAYRARNFAITGEGTAVINANGREMARWGMPNGDPNFVENIHGTHGVTPEKGDVERLRSMGENCTDVRERVFGKDSKLRPCAIEFVECSQMLIEGITLMDSPFWCIHPLYCQDVTVRNVTIDSHFPNNDGCDPESSERVLIENCTFRTGDDAVAIKAGRDADGRRVNRPSRNIIIRNCLFYSKCNGLCIGSEMSGGVSNIFMRNITIGDVKNALLFKSNLDRGGYIENVFVDSIDIASAAGAVLRFETNYFGYRGGNMPARYSDFQIRNVRAKRADSFAIYFDGNSYEPIRNISVENFSVLEARDATYLYKTFNCSFKNCFINSSLLPLMPKEDIERKKCDVW